MLKISLTFKVRSQISSGYYLLSVMSLAFVQMLVALHAANKTSSLFPNTFVQNLFVRKFSQYGRKSNKMIFIKLYHARAAYINNS